MPDPALTFPEYPLPAFYIRLMLKAIFAKETRSFRQDVVMLAALLKPPLRVHGEEHIPQSGPCLITINHYARRGFPAWWLAMGTTSVIPADVHWMLAGDRAFPERRSRAIFRPFTKWLYTSVANVYQFTPMPPMPPDPAHVQRRAQAVRRVLTLARRTDTPLIGFSPEGHDQPGGALDWPHPGVGRFIMHLVRSDLKIAPVGVYEAEGALQVNFGPHYRLDLPPDTPRDQQDRMISQLVMERLARQIPPHLRGPFQIEGEPK